MNNKEQRPSDSIELSKKHMTAVLRHGWLVVFGVFLWIIAYFLDVYTVYVFSWLLVYMIAAHGLNLILGYAGQISLAQAAFLGIGAYTVALLTGSGYSFWLALPAGGLLSFMVGALLGFPSLKVKHHYLAMVTIGFNVIVYKILINEEEITGGSLGIRNIIRPRLEAISFQSDLDYAHLVLIVSLLMMALMYWILNTRWGRAFKMIRENEVRAEILGVNLRAYKIVAFAIGSGYGGVAGGLLAPLLGYIDPTTFQLTISFNFLLMVLIGGMGSFSGPIIGVSIVLLFPEILRITNQFNIVLFSLLACIILLVAPKGGSALLDKVFELVTGRKAPSLTK